MHNIKKLTPGLVVVVLLAVGLGSCQKEGITPTPSTAGLLNPDLTVGLPGILVAWTGGPVIPYTAYIPSDPPKTILYSVGFTVNGKGFVLGGLLYTQSGETKHVPDLWQFDPAAAAWSRLANLLGSLWSVTGGDSFRLMCWTEREFESARRRRIRRSARP